MTAHSESYALRTATPDGDPDLVAVVDRIFQTEGGESRLLAELERGYPRFDPGLSLVAETGGRAAAWALFLPRTFMVRGAQVELAVAGPFGSLPESRGRGAVRYLFDVGLAALEDRGLRGAVAVGPPGVLARLGFGPAFRDYGLHVPAEILPEPDAGRDGWRGLASEHLAHLCELQARCYAGVSGSEVRTPSTFDWACLTEGSHVLVHEAEGRVDAWLRFHAGERLEVPECGVADERGVDALLALLARLAREHRRTEIDVGVPPPHPVARALFHRGATAEVSNLGGAACLRVTDWEGLLRDLGAGLARALDRAGAPSFSLEIAGAAYRVTRRGDGVEVLRGRDVERHVVLPEALAPGLVTGHYDDADLAAHVGEEWRGGARRALLSELFPGGACQWTWPAAFDLAAD